MPADAESSMSGQVGRYQSSSTHSGLGRSGGGTTMEEPPSPATSPLVCDTPAVHPAGRSPRKQRGTRSPAPDPPLQEPPSPWIAIGTAAKRPSPGCAAIFLYVAVVTVVCWLPGAVQQRHRKLPGLWVAENATHSLFVPDPSKAHRCLPEAWPNWALGVFCTCVPFAASLAAILGGFPLCEILHYWQGFILAIISQNAAVELCKRWVACPRPCFYDKCSVDVHSPGPPWEQGSPSCLPPGVPDKMWKSFPSGHASNAFCVAVYVSSFLYPRMRRLWRGRPELPERLPRSLSLGSWGTLDLIPLWASLAVLPLMGLAGWAAASRVHDNWHHASDVVTGSVVGGVAARWFYLMYCGEPDEKSMSGNRSRTMSAAEHSWLDDEGHV
eukprot:TRINITY_DN50935_c0_g1_i1.p1 TRINITY_DN50935_c0_g1~~TRINITY_DN50935_c0_g1_i1.p1  ORF type:complete len:410 (+),score=83.53 TRINITY_DN50935_c0_g1_i1:84-1232(+)